MAEHFGIHDETRRAFLAQPIDVFGIPIQPAVLAHMMLLSQHAPNFGTPDMTDVEILNSAIILSTPGPDALPLFDWPEEMWAQERRKMACRIPVAILPELAVAMVQQIAAAKEPGLATEDNGQKKTASAGGSRSSKRPRRNTAGRRKPS